MLARKLAILLSALCVLYLANTAEPQAFRGSGVPATPAKTFRTGSGVVSGSGGSPSGGGFRLPGTVPADTVRKGAGPGDAGGGGTPGPGPGPMPGPGGNCKNCTPRPSQFLPGTWVGTYDGPFNDPPPSVTTPDPFCKAMKNRTIPTQKGGGLIKVDFACQKGDVYTVTGVVGAPLNLSIGPSPGGAPSEIFYTAWKITDVGRLSGRWYLSDGSDWDLRNMYVGCDICATLCGGTGAWGCDEIHGWVTRSDGQTFIVTLFKPGACGPPCP